MDCTKKIEMTDCSVCKDFRLYIIMNYINYTYEQHTGCTENRGASRKAVILRGKVCPEKVNRNVHETSRHNKAQHAVNTVETRRDTTIRRRIDRQPIENKIPFEEIAATRTIEKFLCDLQALILISSGVCSP